MINSSDLINEFVSLLPLWAHKRLLEKKMLVWKLNKEEVIKRNLHNFSCSSVGKYTLYRVPRPDDKEIIFILRLND